MDTAIIFNVVVFAVGALIGGVVTFVVERMRVRGQLIRDAIRYSWKLVRRVGSRGDKQGVGFVRVYGDGDEDRFVEVFREVVGAFLEKH